MESQTFKVECEAMHNFEIYSCFFIKQHKLHIIKLHKFQVTNWRRSKSSASIRRKLLLISETKLVFHHFESWEITDML